jgi:hypothetical protein
MAVASSLQTSGISPRRVQNIYADLAAGLTDQILIASPGGAKSLRVVAAFINNVDAGVGTITFKSKGGGAGTAIGPPIKLNTMSGVVLNDIRDGGWFETLPGQALAIDTAAASATNLILVVEVD